MGHTRSPSVQCLLGLFQKLCRADHFEHPRWYVVQVMTNRVGVGVGRVEDVGGLTQPKEIGRNHSKLHTLSHRGSQLTSQCFNPSSLENKGVTAIGGPHLHSGFKETASCAEKSLVV